MSLPVRILGVDPGSVRTGFAIIDFHGQQFTHVHSGHLALGRGDMAQRLARIFQGLNDMIEQYQPQAAAVETVFVQKNVASAIKLGQARGAAIAAIACQQLSVAEYPPATVKQTIVGGGRADKQQINFMVQRLVALREAPQEDQADALAIAVCHALSHAFAAAGDCAMIGRLSGTLLEKAPPQVLLDVQGVGYELEAPMSTIFALPAEGQAVVLHTHMVVREDAQLLYGFASREERTMFRELLRITGIGAKMALAVLSTMSTSELFSVIEAGDDDRLTRVPGIGKKTAQRVLLEMRGRLSRFEQLGPAGSSASGGAASQDRAEAQDALQALGYSAAEARKLVGKVDASVSGAQDVIRLALQAAAR